MYFFTISSIPLDTASFASAFGLVFGALSLSGIKPGLPGLVGVVTFSFSFAKNSLYNMMTGNQLVILWKK